MKGVTLSDCVQVGLWLLDKLFFTRRQIIGNHWWKRYGST